MAIQALRAPVGNDNKAPWQGRDRTMKLKNVVLGTSALVGVAMLGVAASVPAAAAEVSPGGALDLTLTGFLRAEFGGGEYDDSQLDNSFARGLDFRNDSEVHVLARGKDEQTGLEYGATVEFEADTNSRCNTDETWIFMRGGWGEVRIGDEDGVADNSAVGAQTIAAGTGGIDGSELRRSPRRRSSTSPTPTTPPRSATTRRASAGSAPACRSRRPRTTSAAAPTTASNIARKNGATAMQGENVVEGGLVYDGEFGGVGVLASVVGLYGELVNGGEDTFGDDKWQGVQAGASVDLFGFKLAGSYGYNEVGEQTNQFATAGIGYGFGPVNTSVTYGQLHRHQQRLRGGHGHRRLGPQRGVLGRLSPWRRAWCWPAT